MNNNIINFLEYRAKRVNPLTYKDDQYLLKVASKYFSDQDIEDQRVGRVESKLEDIARDYTIDKSNRVRKKMQQLVDYLIRYEVAEVKHNVFKAIKARPVPQTEKHQKHFFEMHDDVPSEHHTITRLYNTAQTPQDKLLILMCSITGGRINEVLNIKWEDLVIDDKNEAYLRIKNSKINVGGKSVKDEYRMMDINPVHVDKIIEQRDNLEKCKEKPSIKKKCSYNKQHNERWAYVITTETGTKPTYQAVYKRYKKIWQDTYDLYRGHKDYPFPYDRDAKGFLFHAFRRHYITSYRNSFGDDYTKSHHERLQLMIGHKVGSTITDDIYTEFNNEKVVKKHMNSKINLGIKF
jgi:integrase